MTDLRTTATAFAIAGDFASGSPYGTGHINDTFAVTFHQGGTPVRYILQRINQAVFRDVPALMENVARVCAHAQARLAGRPDASRRALTLIPTRHGASYWQDDEGEYWRVYIFVEDATGYDVVENETQAYEAARAFGAFQKLLVDLPGARLHETIPDFHNTRKRLAALREAVDADAHNRAASCKDEITWALEHALLADALLDLHERGLMPQRATHNDTKLNNVLIDNHTHEAMCVIDLDTMMPGLALHDFGDLVRTSTSPVAEDEPDASRVSMQINAFDALVRGYLATAGDILTPTEIDALPLAGMVITFESGIRFLTDYLQGDSYFRTHRPGHNLERCRTQFRLVDSMVAQRGAMEACVAAVGKGIRPRAF
jgi:Ser/Thr protein kinase RdoA (MazF antagonist)